MTHPNSPGAGGLRPRQGAVPKSENLSPEDKALQSEMEALSKVPEANLALVSVQSQLRLAKAVEDLRDGLLDLVDIVEAVASHFNVDLGDDDDEGDKKDDGKDAT